MLVLPAVSLLKMYKNVIQQRPGIKMDNLNWMRSEEANQQGIPKAGWRGGLAIDEMQVQDDVQIVRKGASWELLGFKDVGHTGNLITKLEQTEVLTSTHSLQYVSGGQLHFMQRGMQVHMNFT